MKFLGVKVSRILRDLIPRVLDCIVSILIDVYLVLWLFYLVL